MKRLTRLAGHSCCEHKKLHKASASSIEAPTINARTKENLKLDCGFLFARRDWECHAGADGYAGHLANGGREIVCRRKRPLASLGVIERITNVLRRNYYVLVIPHLSR